MDITKAGILSLTNQRLCSANVTEAEVQDWTVDFLNWAYIIAPESAVLEIALLGGVEENPVNGVTTLSLKGLSTELGVYKVLSVYQSSTTGLLAEPRYRAKLVTPERFQAIVAAYPSDSKVYSLSECVWSQFTQTVKHFRGEDGWEVGLEYIPETLRTWGDTAPLNVPTGWDSLIAIYCAAVWLMQDEEPELAQGFLQQLQAEMGRFGIYYDENPSIAGAGSTP